MEEKDGRKEVLESKPTLDDVLDAARWVFGAKEEEPGMGPFFRRFKERLDEAKKREQIQILDSLEYPGGKRVH
ncbi:MAG: hypothetical protein IH907_10525 [Proteobacteria bacterium]|nr:hypothetical protein [Pseudomonadota bacterium]